MKDMGFEELLEKAYARYVPVAKRYWYTFRRPSVTVGGRPSALFLGNHSSGKSSLINWVLAGESVQDTGVAPTDDGFTFLLHGEQEEDVAGPAALSRLPEEFKALASFGPGFLQHLKVKVRNRDILKGVCLVDSPGMIDAASGTVSRDYDFPGVIRRLAGLCDMVFFLFDPEKPGTTGETVDVFATCLRGTEFKLRVLLNKCDAFTGTYDFARAYGTLCWNLARVLQTKDLPKILTTYSGPERAPGAGASVPLADFNAHRAEFLSLVRNAAARRKDNVFAAAHADFAGLSARMRVVDHVSRRIWKNRAAWAVLGTAACLGVGLVTLKLVARSSGADLGTFDLKSATAWMSASLVTFALGCVSWVGALMSTFLIRRALAGKVDAIFAEECRSELAIGTHDDLRQVWDAVRAETADVVRSAPLALPWFGERRRKRLDADAAQILKAFESTEKETK